MILRVEGSLWPGKRTIKKSSRKLTGKRNLEKTKKVGRENGFRDE